MGGFLALIRQNAALLFWDIPDSKPVWLSGAIPKLKITANSTNREAKVGFDGLGDGKGFGRGEMGVLGMPVFRLLLVRM
jgi:hypothetical protein